jgi:predicted metal-dependent hydrolase
MANQINKEIMLDGQRVSYCLKTSPRARNLRITIKPGGVVWATKPRFLADHDVERFLRDRSDWVLEKISQLKGRRQLNAGTRADFKNNAELARSFVRERIAKYNAIYRVSYNRIAIRDTKTRWGSCSRKGNLNFNYRVALLPENLADYVVVHEMCHLRELNHSARFWDLVAQAVPDYRAARKDLKNYLL